MGLSLSVKKQKLVEEHIVIYLQIVNFKLFNKATMSPPQTKASRLRAMEKDYHLECFKSVVKILKFGQI